MKKPRWIVGAAGQPSMSLSDRQASTAREASDRYMHEHGTKLRTAGGFVLVIDCTTGREERFRVIPRGARTR